MPAKGETYTEIGVDLQAWLDDYMCVYGITRRARVAEILGINRGRITEIGQGKGNKLKIVETIVNTIYKGDYSKMAKYAQDETAYSTLRSMAAKKDMTPHQRRAFDALMEAGVVAIKKGRVEMVEQVSEILKK